MSPRDTTLPPEATSVPLARRFVRDALTSLQAAGACDIAESLVSELATNAVLHARTPFTVEATRDGDVIRVCVLDASPVPARLRTYGRESTTGRGLRLVASLAADWGVQPQGPGKIVWFEVPADGAEGDVVNWDDELDVEVLLASFDDASADSAEGDGTASTASDATDLGRAA